MMNKLLILFSVAVLFQTRVLAQQDPQFSQYMFNHYLLNPAFSGSREVLNVSGVVRDQWLNAAESSGSATQTQTLTVTSPLKRRNMGVGVNFMNDRIGPKTTSSFTASYAYHLTLNKAKLSFGLKAGVLTNKIDWNKIKYKDANDPNVGSGVVTSGVVPTFDFGTYYYTQVGYISFGLTHLNKPNVYSYLPSVKNYFVPHAYLAISRSWVVNDKLILNPSILYKNVLYKGTSTTPLALDINLNARIDKAFWIGASYKHNFGMAALFQYFVNEKMKVGYSYDLGLMGIGKYAGATHEFFLSYDFGIFNSKITSTRFL
jgi:type IX secretion system PorP/SprF family membrane protein